VEPVEETAATGPAEAVSPTTEIAVPHILEEENPTAPPVDDGQTTEILPEDPDISSLNPQFNGEFSEEDLELLWEVWNIVQSDFDGELPNDEELTYGVIRGMLGELDDEFTRFVEPEIAERSREDLEGSFEGIGAFVRENDTGLTEIVRPIDGQPAEAAGLRAGDVVIGVDGEDVTSKSLDEVIGLFRGPRGTDVTLTIARESLDEPFDVTITRARIEIPVVESEMLEEGIAYVRLADFSRNAEEQLELALQELLADNPQGLILDMRDNPGGFLDESIAVADLFLAEGAILHERSTRYNIDQTYSAGAGELAENIPMVVLVNAGSASAAEIVAGALQDNGRAILIGELTFGKGSVQEVNTLSDGSELRVTIARWYTPDDRSIDGAGIEPDIPVETPEDLGGEDDTQLERAIQYLLTGE